MVGVAWPTVACRSGAQHGPALADLTSPLTPSRLANTRSALRANTVYAFSTITRMSTRVEVLFEAKVFCIRVCLRLGTSKVYVVRHTRHSRPPAAAAAHPAQWLRCRYLCQRCTTSACDATLHRCSPLLQRCLATPNVPVSSFGQLWLRQWAPRSQNLLRTGCLHSSASAVLDLDRCSASFLQPGQNLATRYRTPSPGLSSGSRAAFVLPRRYTAPSNPLREQYGTRCRQGWDEYRRALYSGEALTVVYFEGSMLLGRLSPPCLQWLLQFGTLHACLLRTMTRQGTHAIMKTASPAISGLRCCATCQYTRVVFPYLAPGQESTITGSSAPLVSP